MANATGEWVEAGSVRMPVMILVYEDRIDEVGSVWIARSILTGHLAAGTTAARAKECLRKTITGCIELAGRHGKVFDRWFAEQKPADPRFVEEYFQCASEVGRGVEWSPLGGATIAMAPA